MVIRGSRQGDIRVIGLVVGTHVIEDIGRDVPHGVQVIIPGHLAVQSKDLWRAINQKCLFQLPTAAPPPQFVPTSDNNSYEVEQLEAQVRGLSTRLKALEAENKVLREKQDDSQTAQKLDEILSALQNQTQIMVPVGQAAFAQDDSEKVDGEAPMFLPDKIHPEDVEARIDIKAESVPSEAAEAASQLRKLKKSGKNPKES